MPENDKYPAHKSGTFAPVGIILIVAVCVVLAIFIYTRTEGLAPNTQAPNAAGASSNSNRLAPPAAPVPGATPGP